jgi:hypothetical protein
MPTLHIITYTLLQSVYIRHGCVKDLSFMVYSELRSTGAETVPIVGSLLTN